MTKPKSLDGGLAHPEKISEEVIAILSWLEVVRYT